MKIDIIVGIVYTRRVKKMKKITFETGREIKRKQMVIPEWMDRIIDNDIAKYKVERVSMILGSYILNIVKL